MSTLKGKEFTQEDAPASIQGDQEKLAAWQAEQTERYAVVAVDESLPVEDQKIIAEELPSRILQKLSVKARRIAPMLLRMPVADRLALLQAFDGDGNLINPFTMVKG